MRFSLMDATGLYMSTDNTAKGILQLFIGHEAYVAFPYIWTGMNFENVLISAYQVLKDAHGLLTEEQFEQKVNAVYDAFLGSHMSNRDITATNVPAPSEPTSIYMDMNNMYMVPRESRVRGDFHIRRRHHDLLGDVLNHFAGPGQLNIFIILASQRSGMVAVDEQ